MLFSDYVIILKTHCKKRIGEKRLCDYLFEPVIENATLDEDETRPIDISKESVSKMMKGVYPVHQFIRDHIYDNSVIDNLVKAFQTSILPLLIDDSQDLCYQMLQKIEQDNISPAHKSEFKMMAKRETLAPFLADVFVHAISTNTVIDNDDSQAQHKKIAGSEFVIKGIDRNRTCPNLLLIPYVKRIGFTKETIINNVISLINKAKCIKVVQPIKTEDGLIGLALNLIGSPYKYDEKKKSLISQISTALDLDLPEDFFDVGDVSIRYLAGVDSMGMPCNDISGSPASEEKLQALNAIYDAIEEGIEKLPFVKAFSDYYYLELVVDNVGRDYDEDIRVKLKFPKGTLVNAETIMRLGDRECVYLIENKDELLHIVRGEDYLDFDEDYNLFPSPEILSSKHLSFDVGVSDIEDALGYYISSGEEYDTVEIKFNSINQHTAVAFPAVILLNTDSIKCVEYSIRSKRSPDLIEGKLDLSKITT